MTHCAGNRSGWIIRDMESPLHDGRSSGAARADASDRITAHRFSTPVVRELTTRDMDEQRRLVRASLLATAA
jgi:hypothetical protein